MTDEQQAPNRLAAWRKEQGWTQQEVADVVGLSLTTVSKLERGEQNLAPDTKRQVARRLGVRIADLFDVEPLPEAVG